MFKCFSSVRGGLLLALATIITVYLVIWHGAHIAVVLPFLILLACPLMHIFMHGRHASHGKDPLPPPPSVKGEHDETHKA